MKRYFLVYLSSLIALAVAAVAAAGCGGGGSSSTLASGGETTGEAGKAAGGANTTGKARKGTTGEAAGGAKKAGGAAGGGGKDGGSAGAEESAGEGTGREKKAGEAPTGPSKGGKGGSGAGNGTEAPRGAPKPSSGQLSSLKFIREVRTICARGKKKGVKEMATYVKSHQSGSKPNPQLLVQAVRTIFLPSLQSQVDEIRALHAPPGDEAKVEAFLAAMEKAIDASAESIGPSNLNFGENFKRSAELANEYGIHRCAYG